ncbi:terpenoid synthase [Penicillium waksmanii]|uniref:terpenoid synthase n=1 Tax=Penicillium waksmanii TaxID=69791 RepID=UPI0025465BF4|nr:terpenoid synthase [Penicillium waksmanii]KAJ5999759.1 terpenoid synthase [Penicillium waksmanii]
MIRLMQLESTCSKDYVPLAEILGKFFQIRDDYKNLRSNSYAQKKGSCEDITEGKFSFPIVHNMHKDPESKVVGSILRQKVDNERMKDVVLICLESTRSFEYTERMLEDLARQARILILEMDDGRGKAQKLLNFVKTLQI